jgi:hypothetical protein
MTLLATFMAGLLPGWALLSVVGRTPTTLLGLLLFPRWSSIVRLPTRLVGFLPLHVVQLWLVLRLALFGLVFLEAVPQKRLLLVSSSRAIRTAFSNVRSASVCSFQMRMRCVD